MFKVHKSAIPALFSLFLIASLILGSCTPGTSPARATTITPTLVVAQVATQGTLDVRVGQGSDDAVEDGSGIMNIEGGELATASDGTLSIGLRWQEIAIPQGARITRAYVQFTAAREAVDAAVLVIKGQAANSPATFRDDEKVSMRSTTEAFVSWIPDPWIATGENGLRQETPDLRSLFQEIVDRPAWQSGNAVVLVISGTGERVMQSYEGAARQSALLHIEYATLPAFPGAEGFGAYSIGGRGGKIMEVTNLNDSGPGSLRVALEATGPRIVVFRTGGTIYLTDQIWIDNPYVTIAGQTAPGGGVAVVGGRIKIRTHDVIIRGIRMRAIDAPEINLGGEKRDAITLENDPPSYAKIYNILIDHCSISWGIAESFSTWSWERSDIWGITVQWSIISETLRYSLHPEGEHSRAVLIGEDTTDITFHHDLLADNLKRNPEISPATEGLRAEFINNVVYNWGTWGSLVYDSATKYSRIHYIGNFGIPGPDTSEDGNWISRHLLLLTPAWGSGAATMNPNTRLYITGNRDAYRTDDASDDWLIVRYQGRDDMDNYRSDTPVFPPTGVTTQSATDAMNLVLQSSGAIVPARDTVDQRIIREVQSNTGSLRDCIVNCDAGDVQVPEAGWPELKAGTPPTDSDHDGIPDEWETSHGINPNDAGDGNSLAPSEYTWVEEYINNLIPLPSGAQAAVPAISATATALPRPALATIPPAVTATAAPTQRAGNGPDVIAYRLAVAPTIDGKLDDWAGVPQADVIEQAEYVGYKESEKITWDGPKDLNGTAYLGWDDQSLYIAVHVTDDVIQQRKRGADLWLGDHIELWLDMQVQPDFDEAVPSSDDFQLGFSPGARDGSTQADMVIWVPSADLLPRKEYIDKIGYATAFTDDGYIIEAQIPWRLLGNLAPRTGQVLGISIQLSDTDSPGRDAQEMMMASSPRTVAVWGDPTLFNNLILEETH